MTKESRDEDSGLHDIRSLASSTKARLSSRRSTASPIVTDEEVLASSSAGWKVVALPEPAKMVSLPELAELPSAKEIKEKDKAARKAKAAEEKAAKAAAPAAAVEAPAAAAVEASAATSAAATEAAPAASLPSIGARVAAKQAKPSGGSKTKVIALAGMGVAAAAAVGLVLMTNKDKGAGDDAAKAPVATAAQPEYKSTAKMLPPPPPPAPAAEPAAVTGAGSAAPEVQQIAAPEDPEPAKAAAKAPEKNAKTPHKVEVRDTSMTDKADKEKAQKQEAKPAEVKAKGSGEEEPSFDALLKEAGVNDANKPKKVVLDKKSLSGSDIKTGMGAVQGKAQACYAGTQGTAAVKLTVLPSGQVEKVHVSGVFAGTPVASCIEAAVKGATFPPWDGGPQTFGYSYLLAE